MEKKKSNKNNTELESDIEVDESFEEYRKMLKRQRKWLEAHPDVKVAYLKLCDVSFLLFIQTIPRSIDIYKDGGLPEGLQDLEELGLAFLWDNVYFSSLDFESTRNLGHAFVKYYRSASKGKINPDQDKTHLMIVECFLKNYNARK